MMMKTNWQSVLELNQSRKVVAGTEEDLVKAVAAGADLRIYTEFYHHEHVEPGSENQELVKEVSEFRVTYVIEQRWVSGIMTLRQPILPPQGFGPRPSMSFFLYNQDGQQAIARPHLDEVPQPGNKGETTLQPIPEMPKYKQLQRWDGDTNCPSENFIYEFERYRYYVRDDWQELLRHDEQGNVLSGSYRELMDAFESGCEIKVGIGDAASDLVDSNTAPAHELFVQIGPGYEHTGQDLFSAGTHPIVRVQPAIPMAYQSDGWDFGWYMVRTDGLVSRLLVDPYSLQFKRSERRHAMRWFAH